ncbi:MAG: hypothetical protein ACI4M5_00865 [Christensenellales bacterium]
MTLCLRLPQSLCSFAMTLCFVIPSVGTCAVAWESHDILSKPTNR